MNRRTALAGERVGDGGERRREFAGGEGVEGAEAASEFDGGQAALATRTKVVAAKIAGVSREIDFAVLQVDATPLLPFSGRFGEGVVEVVGMLAVGDAARQL
jgi:hypothetical protein